ncbi:putative anion transporter 3, chloroplastic, partial [Cucurbita argyrosperma subsp. argyrosperma]
MATFSPPKPSIINSRFSGDPSELSAKQLSLIKFPRAHSVFQSGILRNKWGNHMGFHRVRVGGGSRGLAVVRCTAEGIERSISFGKRSIGSAAAEERGIGGGVGIGLPERFKVVALTAFVMCLCNADRVVMSVAIVPLAAKYGWSNSFLGIVQKHESTHGFCCSFMIVRWVLVENVYGGKRVMAWGVALWSLATLLTPLAANHSTTSLLAVRAFFGLAEGVAMPSMSTLLSRWFPSHERASAVGMSMAGFHLGNVVGLLLTPIMLSSIGVTGPFLLFSSLGLVWLMSWIPGVTNNPRQSQNISTSELRLIEAGKADSSPQNVKHLPLSRLLSKLPTWAIIFANMTNNWVRILCSSLVDASIFQNRK